MVTYIFQEAGLRVCSASSGEAALTILRDTTNIIDWLFTDVNLPGFISGWIVASEYRLTHPFRPIIYASTSANRPCLITQGSIFVEKPFDPHEILRIASMMQGRINAHFDNDRAAARQMHLSLDATLSPEHADRPR